VLETLAAYFYVLLVWPVLPAGAPSLSYIIHDNVNEYKGLTGKCSLNREHSRMIVRAASIARWRHT